MVNFIEAGNDVLTNDVEYKRVNSNVGIRKRDVELEFFNLEDSNITTLQTIISKDLKSKWVKIEKDEYWNYLSEIKKLANVESNFSKAQYEFMKFIKLIKKDIKQECKLCCDLPTCCFDCNRKYIIIDKRSGLK